MIKSPVVLFIYKRSDNISKIFKVLREVRPQKLFIISDGAEKVDDVKRVKSVRSLVETYIDWPCIVKKNYANTNQGLKERFRTGIDWVFSHTDRAIFIEDDCIPDKSFFRFCDELLEKYKEDARIFSIAGNNFQFGAKRITESYYFSKYPHVWGWATWKRAWEVYDSDILDWPTRRHTGWLREMNHDFIIFKFWKYIFDRLYVRKINTWDYQLTYASFKNHGFNIIPSVNLVTNVGYGEDSTNIKRLNKTLNVPALPTPFPLKHPPLIKEDQIADRRIDNLVYLHPLGKLSLLVKSILGIL